MRCSKTRGGFTPRQKVSARAGVLAVAPYFLLYHRCEVYVSYYPSLPPFLFIFLSSVPFPSSMRAVSESQPSWMQHCARVCASRPSLLKSPCAVRIIPPASVSWIVACSAIAGTRCTWVCACVTRCNTLPDRAMIFVRSLMNAARKSPRDPRSEKLIVVCETNQS